MNKPFRRVAVAALTLGLGVAGIAPAMAARYDEEPKEEPKQEEPQKDRKDKAGLVDVDALVKDVDILSNILKKVTVGDVSVADGGILNDAEILNDSMFLNNVLSPCSGNDNSFRQNRSRTQDGGDATTTVQCGIVNLNDTNVLSKILNDADILEKVKVEDVVKDVNVAIVKELIDDVKLDADVLANVLADRY